MQANYIKFPFYARLTIILFGLALIIAFLYIGQGVLFPLLLSLLFAILLRPVAVFFNEKLRFPYVLAVLVSVILFIVAFLSLLVFVSYQATQLTDDWNRITENLTTYYHQLQDWVRERFNISYTKQEKYVEQVTKGSADVNREIAGQTLGVFKDAMVVVILSPVYIFLLLLYKDHLKKFLFRIVPVKSHIALGDILQHIKIVIQNYLVGLLLEMGIVATMVTVGLWIIGAKYALLLGLIAAILNLIPYIGVTFATMLAMFVTLAEGNGLGKVLGVLIISVVVQFIDNNLLVPKIVGSKVRINALIAIFVVVVGGTIAGVAGMFLAIPITAILKVIFDRVDGLKDLGFLMGDDRKVKKNSKS
jgi:predicted PurR-regulated permease PerM